MQTQRGARSPCSQSGSPQGRSTARRRPAGAHPLTALPAAETGNRAAKREARRGWAPGENGEEGREDNGDAGRVGRWGGGSGGDEGVGRMGGREEGGEIGRGASGAGRLSGEPREGREEGGWGGRRARGAGTRGAGAERDPVPGLALGRLGGSCSARAARTPPDLGAGPNPGRVPELGGCPRPQSGDEGAGAAALRAPDLLRLAARSRECAPSPVSLPRERGARARCASLPRAGGGVGPPNSWDARSRTESRTRSGPGLGGEVRWAFRLRGPRFARNRSRLRPTPRETSGFPGARGPGRAGEVASGGASPPTPGGRYRLLFVLLRVRRGCEQPRKVWEILCPDSRFPIQEHRGQGALNRRLLNEGVGR